MFRALGTVIDALICFTLAVVVGMLTAGSAGSRRPSPQRRSRRFD
jgi:hypothetical protein